MLPPLRRPRLVSLGRSLVLCALLATLLGGASGCSRGAGEASPRNAILVTLDTTRPDFFGSWGSERDLTPNMDALAEEGARFSMAVSASALTPVSHASILTGQTPYQHGLRIMIGPSGFRLPSDVPTLASTLEARGYTTAAYHSAFPVSAIYGFDRAFDIFEDVSNVEFTPKPGQQELQAWDVPTGQRRSDETTEMVLDFLADTEEPFFLWIHYWDPHDLALTPDREFLKGQPPIRSKPKSMAFWREVYGLEIAYVDHGFGRVLDALRESGRYENTLIAIIADHGEGLDDGLARHGWAAHRILYQEQIHVPLIVRAPGAPEGVVIDSLVRSIDVFPTILDYLDVSPEAAVEGRSLRPLMEGDEDQPRVAYADQINLWDENAGMVAERPKADFLHMAMDDRYKLIYRPSYPEESELYDYRADPGEERDLFHASEARDVRERLLEELARRAGWVLEPFPAGEGEGMSESGRRMLADLGYTESAGSPSQALWDWRCPVHWTPRGEAGACPECDRPSLPARRPAQ